MSFEKMKDINQTAIHDRACMMLYHFTPAELKQIQSVARLTGLKDQILLSTKHSEVQIRDILDNKLSESDVECLKEKAIIFNNTPSTRMNAFIEGLKKMRIQRPLIAVVTETSIDWTLSELLMNLVQERQALRNNQFMKHD